MGLSTREVSSDSLDWSKALLQTQSLELLKPPTVKRQLPQNQQQHPPEKCPRCDSMNTKFCYYNNYNKLQPRYFCKACKRHWTKGGTLRNVPVGGGRKNKRHKTSNANSSTAAKASANKSTTSTNVVGTNYMAVQAQQHCQNTIMPTQLQQNLDSKGFCNNSGMFVGSASNQQPFFWLPSSGPFASNLASVPTPIQALKSNVFAAEESKVMQEFTQPWQVPSMNSTGMMDSRSCWTLEDIDRLVSSDFKMTWDDNEIKP